MEAWVWLVVPLMVSFVSSMFRLVAFRTECRLRRELERRSITLLKQVYVTGDAHDVDVMGAALERTISVRGPLPSFSRQRPVPLTAASGLSTPTDRPAPVQPPGTGDTAP